jgi:hypothetical protein
MKTMEALVLVALAIVVSVAAIRRRARARARAKLAKNSHEPLIRQNHQDWKDSVYNPKDHRSPRPPCS